MGKMPIVKRRRARWDPTPEKEAGAREKEGGRAVACPYELAGEGGGQASKREWEWEQSRVQGKRGHDEARRGTGTNHATVCSAASVGAGVGW